MKSKKQSFLKFKHILRFGQTVRYLKWQQIFYRFYYPVKRIFYYSQRIDKSHIQSAFSQKSISFPSFPNDRNYVSEHDFCFTFLNRSQTFHQNIDWKFNEYGRLWNFNLHYFNWLNDENLSKEFCLASILQWIDNNDNSCFFTHSYPSSLRIRNWIKFLLKHDIKNEKILQSLFQQSDLLYSFPEYEIMGNHLLENAFTLLWAGGYFEEPKFLDLGIQIVRVQLEEQILNDGAHFEKSISYHCITLKNILEILFLYENNFFTNEIDLCLFKILKINASKMLSHLFVLTKEGTCVAHFGDSNEEMFFGLAELMLMAQNLRINREELPLTDSGFRVLASKNIHVIFNMGNICANYQPGHTHADVFSFCVYINDKPVIVDRAVSSYDNNEIRAAERATSAHNTISVEDQNIHDVWAAFRLGKRATISLLEESKDQIVVSHDGYYSKMGITHKRSLEIKNNILEINDELFALKNQKSYFYLHFHPSIRMVKTEKGWVNDELGFIINSNCSDSYIEEYKYSVGMNKSIAAQRIVFKIKGNKISTQLNYLNEKID